MERHRITSDTLNIAYIDQGPKDGRVIFLLHGWPDDVRAWDAVAAFLESKGFRLIVPFLRGFGDTTFRFAKTVRDASAVAIAQDVIDLANHLQIKKFSVGGHDWGARAAYTLAALFPERLYAIAALSLPYQPRGVFKVPSFSQSRLFWYQWFMLSDAGADAVKSDPIGFAYIQWKTWSPAGWFEHSEFDETAKSFENPDWVAITLNGYRRRFKWEPSDERYDELRARLSMAEEIAIPTLMIQGGSDTCDPPEGSEDLHGYFIRGYERFVIPTSGHFPMREAPDIVGEKLSDYFSIYSS